MGGKGREKSETEEKLVSKLEKVASDNKSN